MKYKYKIILINDSGYNLKSGNFKLIQSDFDDGWEYVDQIQQNGYEWSAIGIVLRKESNSGQYKFE